LAAQLFLGAYDDRSWQAIGETLLEWLDRDNLNLRSVAAYKIGQFCKLLFCEWEWQDEYAEDISDYTCLEDGTWKWVFEPGVYKDYERSIRELPALEEIANLIRRKELDRPGVAGAWLHGGKIGFTNLEIGEWILDLLEQSPTPEPDLPYFSVNLAFYAHEWFSRDAVAIRRLIDMGRTDIAIAAATDETCKIAALEPLLIELGNQDDSFQARLASWQLAYYYHYLHPNGAKLGYVEQIDKLPEIDLFLLFSRREMSESPYAVVMYAKDKEQRLKPSIAQKWLDLIFPRSIRGRGFIDRTTSDRIPHSDGFDRVTISYRSDLAWNPKQFLR
jgi:hypothetical protein